MKVLFVSSGNAGNISPFIKDQAEALEKEGIKIDFFLIKGTGILGYLKNLKYLNRKIEDSFYDIIHAHYGLSGLFANLQRKIPVVTTFHGSDVNVTKNRLFSKLAAKLSTHSIFVSHDLQDILNIRSRCTVIPCGVDTDVFKPSTQTEDQMKDDIKILFSSSFERKVKNPALAKKAIAIVKKRTGKNIDLIELKGYDRQEVAELMNKANLCLLTSYTEGSPQFIKEAMACNRPCVATNVGDIEWLFGDLEGYYLCEQNLDDVTNKIIKLINDFHVQTNGRDRILDLGLDAVDTAKKIDSIYKRIT